MKLTKSQLRAMILEELTRSTLLTEEEKEESDDSSDLFGDAEGDDKKGDEGEKASDDESTDQSDDEDTDKSDEEDDSEKSGEEEGGEDDKDSEKDEEDEEIAAGPVGDEVDVALKDVMADFEKRALDAAVAKSSVKPVGVKKEGRLSLVRLLFEADNEIKIDVGTFAADVARLISNYDTLIDMEGVIYTKAMDFIEKKYGKDYADQLRDTLAREHNIEINVEQDPEAAEKPIFAVGATGAGGGA